MVSLSIFLIAKKKYYPNLIILNSEETAHKHICTKNIFCKYSDVKECEDCYLNKKTTNQSPRKTHT